MGGHSPVNLIVIMNESFSDLTETFGLETNEDPMPFLHGLTENTVKGTALLLGVRGHHGQFRV